MLPATIGMISSVITHTQEGVWVVASVTCRDCGWSKAVKQPITRRRCGRCRSRHLHMEVFASDSAIMREHSQVESREVRIQTNKVLAGIVWSLTVGLPIVGIFLGQVVGALLGLAGGVVTNILGSRVSTRIDRIERHTSDG